MGLVVALVRLRRPPYLIVLAWVPVMSVTAILTLGGQPTKRALGALPAIAMLVAIGALAPLDRLRQAAEESRSKLWRGVAATWMVAMAIGFGYSAYATYRDYFLVWGSDRNLFTHFEAGRDAIGHYAGTLPTDEVVYSSPEMPDHPAIVYNSGARPGMKGYNGRLCIVYPEQTQHPTTYIIVQHDEQQSLDLLARIYPEGEAIGAGPDFFGQPFFTAYRVPQGATAQLQPTHAVRGLVGGHTAADRVRSQCGVRPARRHAAGHTQLRRYRPGRSQLDRLRSPDGHVGQPGDR